MLDSYLQNTDKDYVVYECTNCGNVFLKREHYTTLTIGHISQVHGSDWGKIVFGKK
jgi:5-methylcytosine-specific restriction endonuclease McrA